MNSTILKRLRISQAENSVDWKWDLRSFLLMFNSTPHSTTGEAPSALMFGRVLRDKIPSIHNANKPWIEGVKDQDWERKLTAAESTNRQRNAQQNQLEEGDIVVAKRIAKENKLSTNYSSEKFQVVRRQGSEAEIRSLETGKIYRRNVTHLKLIGERPSELDTSNLTENQIGEPPSVRRSHREMKRPEYLKNYVQTLLDLNYFVREECDIGDRSG